MDLHNKHRENVSKTRYDRPPIDGTKARYLLHALLFSWTRPPNDHPEHLSESVINYCDHMTKFGRLLPLPPTNVKRKYHSPGSKTRLFFEHPLALLLASRSTDCQKVWKASYALTLQMLWQWSASSSSEDQGAITLAPTDCTFALLIPNTSMADGTGGPDLAAENWHKLLLSLANDCDETCV